MNVFLAVLFVANAAAHIVSFQQLRKAGSENAIGVLAFAGINAALAIVTLADISWAYWPALAFPSIGGVALTATTIVPGKGKPIDLTILALDVVTVIAVIVALVT